MWHKINDKLPRCYEFIMVRDHEGNLDYGSYGFCPQTDAKIFYPLSSLSITFLPSLLPKIYPPFPIGFIVEWQRSLSSFIDLRGEEGIMLEDGSSYLYKDLHDTNFKLDTETVLDM